MLESLISEKRLLQAAVLLVKSLKTISKPDMVDIGAVADLRTYLTTQESVCPVHAFHRRMSLTFFYFHFLQSLRDILIEELHSHLYLKAFWCDRRWSPYTPNQTTRTAFIFSRGYKQLILELIQSQSPNSTKFRMLKDPPLRLHD